MKPKNFPARKLARQKRAAGDTPSAAELTQARAVRTKKKRGPLSQGQLYAK